MTQLLVEKYRPKTLDDMVGFKVTGFKIDQSLPHLLLYGPPGTGKTTLAKVIIRSLGCDYLILNSSDERGIDTVRDKVKSFASTQSSTGGIKILVLDEADALTQEAQASLRNLMETYSSNCRFIITANYVNKIIDPIQSRCVKIKFDNMQRSDIIDRLKYICGCENIPYDDAALDKIVDRTGSDIRSAINKIEENKDGVSVSKLSFDTKIANDVFALLQMGDFEEARKLYLNAHTDIEQLLKDLYDVIYGSGLPQDAKRDLIIMIADTYKWLPGVAWKEILLESLFIRIGDKLNA